MRLLHITGDPWGVDSLNISLCDTIGIDIPPYMILSHRWRDEEVSFSDMIDLDTSRAQSKKGYKKIEASCRKALQEKLEYAWVDTCCIDKSSSAELSEAINSMYNWYAQSTVCFAYLDDVENNSSMYWLCKESVWFTRGWTLQELIAPKRLHFYSKDWMDLGTRSLAADVLALGSGIAKEVLLDPSTLDNFCAAEKMSWASKRKTTRGEDEAYSLMGLFGVNMPPLYGEGQRRAFRRLQVEIMQTSHDHTLFAWDQDSATGDMLAPSAQSFGNGGTLRRMDHGEFIQTYRLRNPKLDYNMTNLGLHIELPMHPVPKFPGFHFAFLACKTKDVPQYLNRSTIPGTYIAICLRSRLHGNFQSFERAVFDKRSTFRFEDIPFLSIDVILAWISEPKHRFISIASALERSMKYEMPSLSSLMIEFKNPLKARTSILSYDTWYDSWANRFDMQVTQLDHFQSAIFLFDGMYMVLGSADQQLWLCMGELLPDTFSDAHIVGKALSFPFGSIWKSAQQWDCIYFLGKELYELEFKDVVSRAWSTTQGDYILEFSISSSEISICCSVADPSLDGFENMRRLRKGPKFPAIVI